MSNNDLNDFEFEESEKSIGYNNVYKLINSLKEKNPYVEFIDIKAIIVAMINLKQELTLYKYFYFKIYKNKKIKIS